jgi:hypothetical protein
MIQKHFLRTIDAWQKILFFVLECRLQYTGQSIERCIEIGQKGGNYYGFNERWISSSRRLEIGRRINQHNFNIFTSLLGTRLLYAVKRRDNQAKIKENLLF